MPYATSANLTERFGTAEIQQLSDRELPSAGGIVATVVDRALADADGVINRYLGARFVVPLALPYPQDLVRVACDIARYMLHDLSVPEQVRQHYEDSLTWLRLVGDGKLPLVADTGESIPTKGSGSFSRLAVSGYPSGSTFGDSFASAWAP